MGGVFAIGAAVASGQSTWAIDLVRTVALTNKTMTIAGGSDQFFSLDTPILDNWGRTVFRGGTLSNGSGLWVTEASGAVRQVARTGRPTPNGGTFSSFSDPMMSDLGPIIFDASTSPTSGYGWIERSAGNLSALSVPGGSLPGIDSSTHPTSGGAGDLQPNGNFVYSAGLSGTVSGVLSPRGLWADRGGGALEFLARSGDAAPGISGSKFGFLFAGDMNARGQVLVGSDYIPVAGGAGSSGSGYWLNSPGGAWQLLMHTGIAAPGTGAGVTFSSFQSATMSPDGATAISASLTGPGVTTAASSGLWSNRGGSGFQLLLRGGDPAPGTTVNFSSMFPMGSDAQGRLTISGRLSGAGITTSNSDGLWRETNTGWQLIARQGDQAPGTSAGVKFTLFYIPTLNSRGQLAFLGTVTGSGVTGANNQGIWTSDGAGTLQLLVREGQLFDVSDNPNASDMRTVQTLRFGTNSNNNELDCLNDLGQVSFYATFTDGSAGMFVSSQVAAAPLTGDFDFDFDVDGEDFLAWQRTSALVGRLGDWESHFGQTLGVDAVLSVPEPGAWALLLVAAVGLGRVSCLRRTSAVVR